MFQLGSTDSKSGTPSSTATNSENYILEKDSFKNLENEEEINENEIVLTLNNEKGKQEKSDQEEDEFDTRSINSYGNENESKEVLNVKKVKHYKLKKFNSHVDYCKNTKNVTLLKYHDLAFIISVIQISVIIVSTCITFFETIREHTTISQEKQRLVSVTLSTYIALIVAVSRFLKFDEKKEQFSKLAEKWNQIIDNMRTMRYEVESIDCYDKSPSHMKKLIYNIIKPEYRKEISILDNETDNLINMKEKTYYKNKLMNMRLDEQILERHGMLFDTYKKLQNSPDVDTSLDKYRELCCFPYGFGISFSGSKYDKFFKDMERFLSPKNNPNHNHNYNYSEDKNLFKKHFEDICLIRNKYDLI